MGGTSKRQFFATFKNTCPGCKEVGNSGMSGNQYSPQESTNTAAVTNLQNSLCECEVQFKAVRV
jgi:hypothetical protein